MGNKLFKFAACLVLALLLLPVFAHAEDAAAAAPAVEGFHFDLGGLIDGLLKIVTALGGLFWLHSKHQNWVDEADKWEDLAAHLARSAPLVPANIKAIASGMDERWKQTFGTPPTSQDRLEMEHKLAAIAVQQGLPTL